MTKVLRDGASKVLTKMKQAAVDSASESDDALKTKELVKATSQDLWGGQSEEEDEEEDTNEEALDRYGFVNKWLDGPEGFDDLDTEDQEQAQDEAEAFLDGRKAELRLLKVC